MSIKLKALGLATLAALAVGAFGVMGATAETGGHFTSNSPSEETAIKGTVNGSNHTFHFQLVGLAGEVGCEGESHTTTGEGSTVTELKVEGLLTKCYTTPEGEKYSVHVNECYLIVTSVLEPEANDGTVRLECPEGQEIEMTHPNCLVKFPEQLVEGVTYTGIEVEGAEAITIDVGVSEITAHLESFGCLLVFGTKRQGELYGSATFEGFEPISEERVDITAT